MLEIFTRYFKKLKRLLAYYLCDYIHGYAPLPSDIYITISNKCNMNCKSCDVGQKQTGSPLYKSLISAEELPVEQWRSFIDDVSKFRPTIILDTAEPLLYKDICGLIGHIKDKGLRCVVTTNGFMLEKLAKGLIESGLDRINISIDGPEEIHDEIRGVKGAFERAVKGIKKLLEFDSRLQIGIHYTISNHNFFCLCDTIEVLKRNIAWDSFMFIHASFVTQQMASRHNELYADVYPASCIDISGIDPEKVQITKLADEIKRIRKMYRRHKVCFHPDISLNDLHAYYQEPAKFINSDKCRAPWLNCNITANGDVLSSNRCQAEGFGNILTNRFSYIWNNEKFREYRHKLKKAKSFPICSRCSSIYLR